MSRLEEASVYDASNGQYVDGPEGIELLPCRVECDDSSMSATASMRMIEDWRRSNEQGGQHVDGSTIHVLVCTANIGNTEPSPDCFDSLIPEDGNIAETIIMKAPSRQEHGVEMSNETKTTIVGGGLGNGTNCESTDDGRPSTTVSSFQEDGDDSEEDCTHVDNDLVGRSFDLIVVGMQESTFITADDMSNTAKTGPVGQIRRVTSTATTLSRGIVQRTTKLLSSNKVVFSGRRWSTGTVSSKSSGKLRIGSTGVVNCLLQNRCPSYELIVHYRRGEMRLIVLARKDILGEITELDCRAENTGIGSVLPNKGGVVATLSLRKTSLAFVTAHLAAHEGANHYASRCDNIASILDGAKVGPSPRWYDASLTNHHCFVFGDLNFRVDFGNNVDTDSSVRQAFGMINRRDWEGLNNYDELSRAVRGGDCLAGFQTPICDFPPTFKVKKQEGYIYSEKRTPSYTDRILWTSLKGMEKSVQSLSYRPCPNYISSDHKPVRGVFAVRTNAPAPLGLASRVGSRATSGFASGGSRLAVRSSAGSERRSLSHTNRRIWWSRGEKSTSSAGENSFGMSFGANIFRSRLAGPGAWTKKTTTIFISDIRCFDLRSAKVENGEVDGYKCYVMCDASPRELIGIRSTRDGNTASSFRHGKVAYDGSASEDFSSKCTICVDATCCCGLMKRAVSACRRRRRWRGMPRTKSVLRCKNPSWGDEELVVKLVGNNHTSCSLKGAMLYINVLKYGTSADDASLLGTARLNLSDLCFPVKASLSSSRHHSKRSIASSVTSDSVDGMLDTAIAEPLLMNGRVSGTIKCNILIWHIVQDNFALFKLRHNRRRKRKKLPGSSCLKIKDAQERR